TSQKPDNVSSPLCLPHATATSTSLPKWRPKILAKTNEMLLLQYKERNEVQPQMNADRGR
ncbi:MAG: hypothetical protein WAK31_09945, partial [Chthoniobacterales bacterium]